MRFTQSPQALVKRAARRPLATTLVVLALALCGAALATTLAPSTATSTYVSSSSASYRATQRDYRQFGGDAVEVLVREPLSDLVESADLGRLSELEACLAGNVLQASSSLRAFVPQPPSSRRAPYGGWRGPCGQLARSRGVQVVYGPGTFLNQAVIALNRGIGQLTDAVRTQAQQAAIAAYRLALAQHQTRAQALRAAESAAYLAQQNQENQLAQLAVQSGVDSQPAIDNATFISEIVFDQSRGVNQPKAKFAYLFPSARSALIQVRLRAGLSTGAQARVIALIRRAVRMPMFHLAYGGTYTVTGEPVVVSDLTSQITRSLLILLLGAALVMAVVLALVFRRPLRLLPLAIALAGAGITFGILALAGAKLTMASIAALPIMIGLAVDYAIQFQARAQECWPAGRRGERVALAAVSAAARAGAPTIVAAALATGAGFLVLLLSPVPMVRGFGLLLVLGIAVALACALAAGSAVLVLAEREGGAVAASLRGAGELLGEAARRGRKLRWPGGLGLRRRAPRVLVRSLPAGRPEGRGRLGSRLRGSRTRWPGLLASLTRWPARVVAIGLLLAVIGWVADTQSPVQSDITKLVPSSMPALRDLRTLERITGSSGEIDVIVHARDVATAPVVRWMISYENGLLDHFGYSGTAGCAKATLCPALSLPDLFSSGGQTSADALTTAQISALVDSLPDYFKRAVLTGDQRDADLAFGIRLMPLSRQQRVIAYMRSQLHPPRGVSAQLAGLPVLAAQASAALSSSGRRLLTLLAALAAVALALLLVLRRPRRALVPLLPIALASGWSALILYLIGIPLNPMSATLGSLVIAISTEFSVLLSERVQQERERGAVLAEALTRAYRSTGSAVLASGLTAIAGFGVLMLSDITMLRDFGFVTVIDLTVSLAGVLLVLPAALALSERGWALPVGRRPWPLRARRRRAVAA
jgi:hydrophobe/amphiphile efflux-3 (HAE3) family protein